MGLDEARGRLWAVFYEVQAALQAKGEPSVERLNMMQAVRELEEAVRADAVRSWLWKIEEVRRGIAFVLEGAGDDDVEIPLDMMARLTYLQTLLTSQDMGEEVKSS